MEPLTQNESDVVNSSKQLFIKQVIREYKYVHDDKLVMEKKLKELEKDYIKQLIKLSKFGETVCDNCWEIVPLRKNKNTHIVVTGNSTSFMCRKISIENVIINNKLCN